jgi:hypothetical protein
MLAAGFNVLVEVYALLLTAVLAADFADPLEFLSPVNAPTNTFSPYLEEVS